MIEKRHFRQVLKIALVRLDLRPRELTQKPDEDGEGKGAHKSKTLRLVLQIGFHMKGAYQAPT